MTSETHKYGSPYELGRLALIGEMLPFGPGRAMDIGCGTGEVSALLVEHGFRVTGIDVDEQSVRAARQRVLAADFVRLDALAEPLGADNVDVVTACEVLEHFDLDQQRTLLEKIRNILRPGGHLLLSTPNRRSLMSLVGSVVYPLRGRRWDYGDETHRHVHSAASLHSLLRSTAFEVRRQRGFQLLLHRPSRLMAVGMRSFAGPVSGVCYDLVVDAQRA